MANSGIPSASFGVVQLVIDPATPSTLYAVTSLGTIFKSTNSAGQWHPVRGVTSVNFLAINPRNASTLYAASYASGIWKSSDGGDNWSTIDAGLPGAASLLAVDPVTSSTLYCAIYATFNPPHSQLFKSTDAGQSWSPLDSFPASNSPVGSLTFDPVTPSTLYVTKESGEILKSTDGGDTWTFLMGRSGAVFAYVPLAIDPWSPSTLYAGSFAAFQGLDTPGPFDDGTGTISKSIDGGHTWTVLRTGIPKAAIVASFSIDPGGSGTIYATYSGDNDSGVLKSLDGGENWTIVETLPQSSASLAIVVAPASSPMVYAGYWNYSLGPGGVLASTDGGANWSDVNAGLDYIDLRALRLDPVHSGVVYTAGAGGVFRSTDSGASWSPLTTFQVAPQSSTSFTNPFGVGAGIVRSLLIDSSSPKNLYVDVVRVNGCASSDQLVFKSADGGANWSAAVSPPDSGCLVSGVLGHSGGLMVIDPIDPMVLYLQETDTEDQIFTLLKSTDGGANWNTLWDWPRLAAGVNALLIDPTNPSILYAGLDGGGLFKSTDGGATWNGAGLADKTISTLAMDPADPSVIYAATGDGLFMSKDGAADWTANNGPGSATALAIAPGVLYAGTAGSGVYRSTDGEIGRAHV